jgi:hypothetical protein
MVVGVLEVSLHIPDAQSLKDKRRVIQSLKDRIRRRFNVSLAETDGQDTWQRCSLAAAMVAAQRAAVERELQQVLSVIEGQPEIALTEHWIEYY